MHPTTSDLRTELEKSASLLRTLADEVRVQLHLGGLDAKARWRQIEPALESALGQAAKDVSEASRAAIMDATRAVRELGESLRRKG